LGVNSQTEPVTGFSENKTSEFLTPPRDEKITISEYFVNRIGDEAFYNEFGTSDKFKRYVTSLRRLRDIYNPVDLKNYPTIPKIYFYNENSYQSPIFARLGAHSIQIALNG